MNTDTPIIMLSSSEYTEATAQATCKRLNQAGLPCAHVALSTRDFACGEMRPHVKDSVDGRDVFLFHDMQRPNPPYAFTNLLLIANMLVLAGASRVKLVAEYMAWMRQDRKDEPRVSISAKVIGEAIGRTCIQRLFVFDLHKPQLEAHFDMPVDQLEGWLLFAHHYRKVFDDNLSNVCAVGPDIGSLPLVRKFADRLGIPYGVFDKRRPRPGESELLSFMYMGEGSVAGTDAILLDELSDGGGTMEKPAKALYTMGVRQVYGAVTTALHTGDAVNRMRAAKIRMTVLNTISQTDDFRHENRDWLTTLSTVPIVTEVIVRGYTHGGVGVSELFSPDADLEPLYEVM